MHHIITHRTFLVSLTPMHKPLSHLRLHYPTKVSLLHRGSHHRRLVGNDLDSTEAAAEPLIYKE